MSKKVGQNDSVGTWWPQSGGGTLDGKWLGGWG